MPVDVFYCQAAGKPLAFVERADFEDIVGKSAVIKVVGVDLGGEAVQTHHGVGIGIKKRAVGFQMHESAVFQYLAIELHEAGRRQAFVDFLHLGVGKRYPYFRHLAGIKEGGNQLDAGAEKRYVGDAFLHRLLGAGPHPGAFDVDSDEVAVGKFLCHSDGIFTFAATKLQNYGVVVLEKLCVPLSFQWKRSFLQFCEWILEHVGECFHLPEFLQFIFAHNVSIVCLFL